MEGSDDHERNLSGEEHTNDYNQHQGSTLGIPLLSAFSDNAATGKDIMSDPCLYNDPTNLPFFLCKENLSPLLSPVLLILFLFLFLLLNILLLLMSALLSAEQRRMFRTTREIQGRRWTNRTRNLK